MSAYLEPLRPDDGGCDISLDMRTIHVSRWTHWLSDLRPPPMLPQRLKARPHPFSSRNSTHWRRQLPRDLQMVLPPLRRACPSKSGTSSSRPSCASRTLPTATASVISGLRPWSVLFVYVSIFCLCSFEVTVTSLHPPRLCRIAVFSVKPTFLSSSSSSGYFQ